MFCLASFFDKAYQLIKVSALVAASRWRKRGEGDENFSHDMSSFGVIKALTCRAFTSINHPAFLVAADVMDGRAGRWGWGGGWGVWSSGLRRGKQNTEWRQLIICAQLQFKDALQLVEWRRKCFPLCFFIFQISVNLKLDQAHNRQLDEQTSSTIVSTQCPRWWHMMVGINCQTVRDSCDPKQFSLPLSLILPFCFRL